MCEYSNVFLYAVQIKYKKYVYIYIYKIEINKIIYTHINMQYEIYKI